MAGSAKTGEMTALAASIALSGVFLYAGAVKIPDPAGFAWAIHNYRLLPYPAAAALAVYLPWLELGCGLGVLWPKISPGALIVLLGLCLVFSGALASALARNLDISCGCFGSEGGSRASLIVSLLRSVSLVLLCGWMLRRECRQHRTSR
ncbi:MAG: MauE/DoxX family redox-associated membrane protein [Opitutaceae bacterium]